MSKLVAVETTVTNHISARLAAIHPKRILALDGGGTRGIVSLKFLREIERVLGERFVEQGYYKSTEDFRLAHYYDMIGGTSVGSMIATQLAWGDRVDDIESRFETSARKIFSRNIVSWIAGQAQRAVGSLYDARTVRGAVWGVVGNETLGSSKLHTGLTIISKRIDTGSVWAMNNNPRGPFYHVNKNYQLQDLVQASTAAPTYFSPKTVRIFGSDVTKLEGLFVDGGVSPYNLPALKLLMMAGVSGYNFGGAVNGAEDYPKAWPLGADRLLITSVGTGSFDHSVGKMTNFLDAAAALQGMVNDGQQLALTMLQWLSAPRRAWHIDRIYGDLSRDNLGELFDRPEGLMSFQRFDVLLDQDWLRSELGITVSKRHLDILRDFTSVKVFGSLKEIAKKAASQQVDSQDFPNHFDGNLWKDGVLLQRQNSTANSISDAPYRPTAGTAQQTLR